MRVRMPIPGCAVAMKERTLLDVKAVDVIIEARISLASCPAAATGDDEDATREARAVVRAWLWVGSAHVLHFDPRPRVKLEEVYIHKKVHGCVGAAVAAHNGDLLLDEVLFTLGLELNQIRGVV